MSTIGWVTPALPSNDSSTRQEVLVVDFGAQYAQLIARRVRELQVYSRIVPHRISADEVAAAQPAGIILSGGPKSVHVDGAPTLDPAIYDLGIPILGICYGAQLIASQLGGAVGRGMRGEYGRAEMTCTGASDLLTDDMPTVHDVWMSHFDAITEVPDGFVATAAPLTLRLQCLKALLERSGVCSSTPRWCTRLTALQFSASFTSACWVRPRMEDVVCC